MKVEEILMARLHAAYILRPRLGVLRLVTYVRSKHAERLGMGCGVRFGHRASAFSAVPQELEME